MNSISLSELTARIEDAIRLNFSKAVWIRAEISELRENNGHCYMELIEKSEEKDHIIAKCRATCWASIYRMMKPYFESSTGQSLTAGLQILVCVNVEFHSVYGMNLTVRDIDPVYTVGEMAAKRNQIIHRLEADGIADMNKLLPLPALTHRIAIISSPTAAGYEDFINQIHQNPYGFKFYTRLFPATMQGEATESSVVSALDKIYQHSEKFDVVVIIRGGGATADLAAFDSYLLAMNCAQFPLPVIAGIGHQRDISVMDMVAHTSVKTPTAAAEFLIDNLHKSETFLFDLFSDIQYLVENRIKAENNELIRKRIQLNHLLKDTISRKIFGLKSYKNQLDSILKIQILREKNKIKYIEQSILSFSPEFLMKHGYTITTIEGRRVSSVQQIEKGKQVKTHLGDGSFGSAVTDLN